MLIVAKFGGSSLADARSCRTVGEILRADLRRRGVVVSAPGRRFPEDRKVTDLLYDCHAAQGGAWRPILQTIYARFDKLAEELGVCPDWHSERERLAGLLSDGTAERDYVASRGEYFCAKLMAAYLRRPFLDSADWLRMNGDGTADAERSYAALRALAEGDFVTPGFYGATEDGAIRTFPRGGSDVTGALAAAALQAERYENWTDVPGIFEADPAVFPEARPVRHMTYRELSLIGAVGVQVLHAGAILPVREKGIPLIIRSTRQPDDPGTRIAAELPKDLRRRELLCLGCRRNCALLGADAPGEALRAADVYFAYPGGQAAVVPAERGEAGLCLIAAIFTEDGCHAGMAAELASLPEQYGVPVSAFVYAGAGAPLLLAAPDDRCEYAMRLLLSAARSPEDADGFGG